MAAILRSRRSFKPEVLPEVESYMKIGHAYLYIMSFCSTFYLKNWRSYDNFKIWPTFWPRDLVIWPLTYKKYTADVLDQIPYVDQVWCWLVKNCDLYRVTHKQTNTTQTNKQTNR